jgi:N-alpha-acetyltransferase 30
MLTKGSSMMSWLWLGEICQSRIRVWRDSFVLQIPHSHHIGFHAVFTYRYFLSRYPELCIIAVNEKGESIGCVVGKIDNESENGNGDDQAPQKANNTGEEEVRVGYIGMLAVMDTYRRRGIGKALVQRILQRMIKERCISVTLETEVSNIHAQRLYQDIFGFVREERLVRYYINWNDAYRLRLWF